MNSRESEKGHIIFTISWSSTIFVQFVQTQNIPKAMHTSEWVSEWLSVSEWVNVSEWMWVSECEWVSDWVWVSGCEWVDVSEWMWVSEWVGGWVSEWVIEWPPTAQNGKEYKQMTTFT